MSERIYTKIAQDSLGNINVEAYANYVRSQLAEWYPHAQILIETTTTESGIMPLVVEPLENEAEVREDLTSLWRTYHTLEAGMDSRTPAQVSTDMCTAINAELDRLSWSSDTAPEGDTTLDAFPTDGEGIVMVADNQEQTCFYAEPLLRTLLDLAAPISYDDLWYAILPHMIEEP